MHMLKESRQPPETQQFDLYHPMAPLPHSDIAPILSDTMPPRLHIRGFLDLPDLQQILETPYAQAYGKQTAT